MTDDRINEPELKQCAAPHCEELTADEYCSDECRAEHAEIVNENEYERRYS